MSLLSAKMFSFYTWAMGFGDTIVYHSNIVNSIPWYIGCCTFSLLKISLLVLLRYIKLKGGASEILLLANTMCTSAVACVSDTSPTQLLHDSYTTPTRPILVPGTSQTRYSKEHMLWSRKRAIQVQIRCIL